MQVLLCIAYYQPITRGELGQFFGKEISRDVTGQLREARPRSAPDRGRRGPRAAHLS